MGKCSVVVGRAIVYCKNAADAAETARNYDAKAADEAETSLSTTLLALSIGICHLIM